MKRTEHKLTKPEHVTAWEQRCVHVRVCASRLEHLGKLEAA